MTIDNSWFDDGFGATTWMAIIRGQGRDDTLSIASRAWDNGVRLVEVPHQSDEDLEVLTQLAAVGGERDCPVGTGTILTPEQVDLTVAAGARFIVTPDLNPDVVHRAAELGVPVLPGVATARDVADALRLGLTWLKAFPAVTLGPTWIRQMLAPFPRAKFVATGGMDVSTASVYLDAGARAVAMGSAVAQLGLPSSKPD